MDDGMAEGDKQLERCLQHDLFNESLGVVKPHPLLAKVSPFPKPTLCNPVLWRISTSSRALKAASLTIAARSTTTILDLDLKVVR